MKKLVAILLSLTFVFSVSAFAITINESDTRDVYATYQEASDADIVYSIDITWGDMSFTYREASKGTWDPISLQYVSQASAGWFPTNMAKNGSLASNEIKIVNKSNGNIDLTPTFTTIDDEDFRNIAATFSCNGITNNTFNIPKASVSLATEALITLDLSNAPNVNDFDHYKIGTVTLQIN